MILSNSDFSAQNTKLYGARSRIQDGLYVHGWMDRWLYRRRVLKPKTNVQCFEIYKICKPLYRSEFKISAKNCPQFLQIEILKHSKLIKLLSNYMNIFKISNILPFLMVILMKFLSKKIVGISRQIPENGK